MLAESIDRWNRELWDEERKKQFQEAFQEGYREGFHEGLVRMLLHVLRAKFGSLSSEVEERVSSTDNELLLKWGDRVLNADALADVFKG